MSIEVRRSPPRIPRAIAYLVPGPVWAFNEAGFTITVSPPPTLGKGDDGAGAGVLP